MSDKNALYDFGKNTFRLDSIKTLLCEKGIALSDTGKAVKRLRDNASDKYLEIVTPIDIDNILSKMPDCHALATTGEKARPDTCRYNRNRVPCNRQKHSDYIKRRTKC